MDFVDTLNSEFKIGQIWKYKSRPSEPDSRLTVCKVEAAGKLGTVIHVSISAVKIKSPQNKNGEASEISHLPFAESAIKKSVIEIVQEKAALPNYSEGYQTWRKAAEQGKGGVWTIAVSEAIAAMETALNK